MYDDIEIIGDEFAKAEKEADSNHWLACELAHKAEQTGRPEWAWMLSQFSKKSDDQVRNRRNAWVMWLKVGDKAVRDALTFSHFSQGYKYLEKTEASRLVEAFHFAVSERMSVRSFGAFLEDTFGEDPAGRFIARYGRFMKELNYILGMAESNGVPDNEQMLLRNLKTGLEIARSG